MNDGAGNYWIDWSNPLQPKIKRVDKTAAWGPTHRYTLSEARDEIYERLHGTVMLLQRELERVRYGTAKDLIES
ncbi:hypothetical protein [Streptomyces sp. H34-S4]|uniref:hypothetical protein n=1 Tax=Streptomyces sp. H34-S4 TaxID=2996463 RepID=UPI00226DC322|nr:hypothetical protein [Streptomyces sp. H34-S4]MCY0933654.1 hypothetical protein [Streptomyces sp. H34-S4]